jgi:hypothetical protein
MASCPIPSHQLQHFHLRHLLDGLAPRTAFGCVKFVKELQPSKVRFIILVLIDFGIFKLDKERQSAKATSPISVMDSGIVKLVNELQPAKA